MNFDHDFVQVWKFSKDQKTMQMEHFFPQIQMKTKKKGLHQKWNAFFPQIQVKAKKQRSSSKIEHFSPNFRSDIHPFKLLGGGYSQIIGGIYPLHPPPPPPPLFRHPWLYACTVALQKC